MEKLDPFSIIGSTISSVQVHVWHLSEQQTKREIEESTLAQMRAVHGRKKKGQSIGFQQNKRKKKQAINSRNRVEVALGLRVTRPHHQYVGQEDLTYKKYRPILEVCEC